MLSTGWIWKERQYGDLQKRGYCVQFRVASWFDLPEVMEWVLANTHLEDENDRQKVEIDIEEFTSWLVHFIEDHPDLSKKKMQKLIALQDTLMDVVRKRASDARAYYFEGF